MHSLWAEYIHLKQQGADFAIDSTYASLISSYSWSRLYPMHIQSLGSRARSGGRKRAFRSRDPVCLSFDHGGRGDAGRLPGRHRTIRQKSSDEKCIRLLQERSRRSNHVERQRWRFPQVSICAVVTWNCTLVLSLHMHHFLLQLCMPMRVSLRLLK